MPKTTFDPQEVLVLPIVANLATVSKEGAPCNAPAWFVWEEGAIWLLGSTDSSSVKRIENNPQCAIELVHFENENGVMLHLGLRGKASIEPMSPARFRRLLTKYLGDEKNWNSWFIDNIAMIEHPDGRLIKLEPESVFTNNASFFKSGPDLAWPLVSDKT
tara:strand:- start:60 stop:539 length:480 start_codon:yes stop_codon:yes gene_type:complete